MPGTTNVSPALLADIRTKTTFPPIMLVSNFTVATILSPQAQRDTNAPDIGYHYDPMDYIWTNLVMTKNVTLTNGVAVGFALLTIDTWLGVALNSQGSASQMNHICPRSCVQEREQSSGSTFAPDELGQQITTLILPPCLFWGRIPLSVSGSGTIENSTFLNFAFNLTVSGSVAGADPAPDCSSILQFPVLIKNNVFQRCDFYIGSGDYYDDRARAMIRMKLISITPCRRRYTTTFSGTAR